MQWVCEICGYVHDGDDQPDMCPVCAAPKYKFSKFIEEDENDFLNDYEEEDDDFENSLFGDYEE